MKKFNLNLFVVGWGNVCLYADTETRMKTIQRRNQIRINLSRRNREEKPEMNTGEGSVREKLIGNEWLEREEMMNDKLNTKDGEERAPGCLDTQETEDMS